MTDTRLLHVVDAISDGERIDWESVRRHYTDGDAADYCRHLETVSKIGRLTEDGQAAPQDVPESPWVSVLLTVAMLQIAIGTVGTIAYREHTYVNAIRLLTALSFAGAGLVLRQSRNNTRSRDLGAAFLLRAFGFNRNPYTLLFNTWFAPSAVVTLLRSGLAVDAWMPFFIWRFARRFPETSRFTRIDRIALAFTKVAAVVGAALFAINLWAAIAHPAAGFVWTFATTYQDQQRYFATTLALVLPALPIVLIRARSAAADERARVRLFSIAMVVGSAPIGIELILEALVPRYTSFLRGSDFFRNLMVVSVLLPLLTIPFVTGYSVLVHQMLDVRVVVRQGVQYLLAKWTLAILTIGPFGFLASHVYARRNDSVAAVLSDRRGVMLLALAALGSGLLASRKFLIGLLDRWFDRAGTDRTMVLARTGDALRLVRTRSELVASVAEASERALNAQAVVHFFDARRQAYVPFGRGGLPLPAESALGSIMTLEPTLSLLRTDREDSIARYLPRMERLWLGAANICALAPIRSMGVDRPAALIAFGPRRDAMGYSRQDEQFVTALASATGITFENLRLKSEAGEEGDGEFGMLCERCHRVVDAVEGLVLCPCGGRLQAAAVPRRINGKFLVEALLGSGGMGVAYLASDMALHRRVAIKTLPTVSADAMSRLAREARTMAALSHPNLATILGQESWRGTPILVCEYLHRGTLQQRLTRGPLGIDDALTLCTTLLDALDYMHAQAVLHRDIKPSNIAFASDGTPKLLDFGLAGLMERTQTPAAHASAAPAFGTTMAGTIAYLPPAAFRGEAPSVLFDLWALTVVLFESIAGRHPFAAGADTAENICRGRFVTAVDADRDVPETVSAFLREALSSSTHQYFNSSTALRGAVTAIRTASRS